MKLTPLSNYTASYSTEGKTDEEIVYDVQSKIVESFAQLNPKKAEFIQHFTLETSPLQLANNDVYLLGIIITNILEYFGVYLKIEHFTESKQFPKMETLIAFIFHEITKDK